MTVGPGQARGGHPPRLMYMKTRKPQLVGSLPSLLEEAKLGWGMKTSLPPSPPSPGLVVSPVHLLHHTALLPHSPLLPLIHLRPSR